jgi:hypothetical protein
MRRDILLLEQMIEVADQDFGIVHATAQEQLPDFAADLKRVLAAVSVADEEGAV